MPGCSVPHCHRRADKGFRLFVFPKDLERRQLWTQLCNREDKPPPKHARMCEYHFGDDQFEKDSSGTRGKLKNNAIPTIFDTPLTLKKVYVSIKSSREELLKINCVKVNRSNGAEEDIIMGRTFDDIKPEFVDVSQQDDDSFWKNDFDIDSLEQPIEENTLQSFIHRQENFNPVQEDFEDSNASVERLCVEPELPEDSLKSTTASEDIFKFESIENNNVQTVMNRTKFLEEQLKEKDKELAETKRLLSKTLKKVERLKALNDKFQSQILELSGQSNSKSYSRLRKRIKRAKRLK